MFEELLADQSSAVIPANVGIYTMFEPVSGYMILNAPSREFDIMSESLRYVKPSLNNTNALATKFLREMYYCMQTYTTGYLFQYVNLMQRLINRETSAWYRVFVDRRYVAYKSVMWLTHNMPTYYKSTVRARFWKWSRLAFLPFIRELYSRLLTHESSIAGLYRELSTLVKPVHVIGKDNLSANDVLEGASIVYAALASAQAPKTIVELLDQCLRMDEQSTLLLHVTYCICGDRAISVILPAAALALRYEHPENAYLEMVRQLSAAQDGEVLLQAKRLAQSLPALDNAGRVLGTAVDVSRAAPPLVNLYGTQLSALRFHQWKIDELDILSKPSAIGMIPRGRLGYGLITQDSITVMQYEFRRLLFAAIMLQGGPMVA